MNESNSIKNKIYLHVKFKCNCFSRFCLFSAQETFLKGHRLYNVRHSKYPDGAHLILNHYSAKMLREYDSNFHIEPRSSVYRNVNGKLVKDNSFRHRRSPNHFIERLAACCESDTECLFAFCFAGS